MPEQIVLVGPSGTGKTTVKNLLEAQGLIRYGVTCTTRPLRPGEVDGQDYDFLSLTDFEAAETYGQMAERTVYINNRAHRYGILLNRVYEAVEAELPTLWILDTNGLDWMRRRFGKEHVLGIAFTADSFVLQMRLRQRDGRLGTRLDNYTEELYLAITACDHAINTSWRTVDRVAEMVKALMERKRLHAKG